MLCYILNQIKVGVTIVSKKIMHFWSLTRNAAERTRVSNMRPLDLKRLFLLINREWGLEGKISDRDLVVLEYNS